MPRMHITTDLFHYVCYVLVSRFISNSANTSSLTGIQSRKLQEIMDCVVNDQDSYGENWSVNAFANGHRMETTKGG